MRLVLHLVRTDARRFAIPIALWIVITIGGAIMDGLGPSMTADPDGRQGFVLAMLLGWLAATGLGVTLVALIVQQHPAVGSNAWWMTRPVTPRMLLASRGLLLCLLVLGVPAICDAVLMAIHGVSVEQMLRVLIEWSLVGLVALGLVMVAASLTTSLARFALLIGASLIGFAVAINVATMIALSEAAPFQAWGTSDYAAALISRPEDPTSLVVAWILLIAAAMWLLHTLYAHRARARAAAIGLAGGVLALAAAVAWPWPLLHADPGAPAWAASADALRLHGPPQQIYFDNAGMQQNSRSRWRTAHARVFVSGVPEGWFAAARLRQGTMEFDGGSITSGPMNYVAVLTAPESGLTHVHRALQQTLGVQDIAGAGLTRGGTMPIIVARAPEVPSGPLGATYRGVIDIDTLQFQQAAVLPLRPGATFQDGSHRMVIDDVQSLERGPVLRVRTSRATSVLDRRSPPTYAYYLRNRKAGEAVAGTLQSSSFSHVAGQFFFGRYGYLGSPFGFTVGSGHLRFPSTVSAQLPSALAPDGSYRWDDHNWLRAAELVIVKTVDAGTVVRRLELKGLTVNPQ